MRSNSCSPDTAVALLACSLLRRPPPLLLRPLPPSLLPAPPRSTLPPAPEDESLLSQPAAPVLPPPSRPSQPASLHRPSFCRAVSLAPSLVVAPSPRPLPRQSTTPVRRTSPEPVAPISSPALCSLSPASQPVRARGISTRLHVSCLASSTLPDLSASGSAALTCPACIHASELCIDLCGPTSRSSPSMGSW